MVYKYIEELINTEVIITDRAIIPMCEVINMLSNLADVEREIECYLDNLMGDEEFVFELVLPLKSVMHYGAIGIEVVRLPFGSFSINLWEELLADKDNPIFKLLRYFEDSIENLRKVLNTDNYGVITMKDLNDNQIIDIYSLHSYIDVYKDIDKYIVQ